ncbi:MAG: hypothetical protein A2Z60_00930 [Nitrospirae bacterium RIFCSPLOWO2_02_42_7]|nr:MAG: hypothetical protein A2Z60_00930 [Nitrospirae bacterium RIFCSPLOWO2_02_42_7]OGW56999.1 MAG: hypothetical protein A3D21_00590 [Nitrospirae bacterium RIFCSPHIGHO2_02_FULL_42_12]
MKLHFDSNQEYQIEAIRAVADIFEGQPLSGGDFGFSLTATRALFYGNWYNPAEARARIRCQST